MRSLTGLEPFRRLAFSSAAELPSLLVALPPTPSHCTDPLHRVDRSTLLAFIFVGSTSELIIMGHPPLPPQMCNGGSPPAHLSSSYLSDPSWWLQFKWSQPPPRAPEWLFDCYERYNPPANVGRPLRVEGWLQRAIREDQQAAGLLPPAQPGGPIRLGARARAELAYRD